VGTFKLRVINSQFNSCEDVEAADAGGARKQALKAALAIGADEVCKGSAFFAAEVRIESGGEIRERMVIAIGSSRLRTHASDEQEP
jgi:hypothetical protein